MKEITKESNFKSKIGFIIPGNENFGSTGWSYEKKDNAMKKYDEIRTRAEA